MSGATHSETLDRLRSDQPISNRDEDDLERLPFVDLLVEEIRSTPPADSSVIGLTGPWGEGKTSVLNLVADALEEEVVVVRFNPWLFTDAHALVLRFFSELGSQVGRHKRLRKAGRRLASYGRAVAPLGSLVVGPAADVAARSVSALVGGKTPAADEERQALSDELNDREQRILVLIDDIDRLHKDEIVDVMRLVKLVGDLPYVTYLLAFDRPYVESALEREQADGRSYLEKVVQVSFDLPKVRRSKIEHLLLGRLNEVVSPLDYLQVRQERWEEVLARGMLPFFRNLRDVVRFCSSVRSSISLLGKEVALEDVLGLETLRIFEPRVHQMLPSLLPALTKKRQGIFIDKETEEKKEKQLLEESVKDLSSERRTRINDLLAVLFPKAGAALGQTSYESSEWRARRQVADGSVLRTYLHASIEPDMASYVLVETTVRALGSGTSLGCVLGDIDPEVLLDLLSQLPDFQDQIKPSDVRVGVAELLRLHSRLPDDREPLRPIPHFYLKSALRATLGVLPSAADQQTILRDVFRTATLPERFYLITWFGTVPERERKQPEFEILDVEQTQELQAELNEDVRKQGPNKLRDEPTFYWLVFDAYSGDDDHRLQLVKELDDASMFLLLQKFVVFSVDKNRQIFNLPQAEQLFPGGFLSDQVARLESSATKQRDKETLELLRLALDQHLPETS